MRHRAGPIAIDFGARDLRVAGGTTSPGAVSINAALIPKTGVHPGGGHPAGPDRFGVPARPQPPDLPDRPSRSLFAVDWSLFAPVLRREVDHAAAPGQGSSSEPDTVEPAAQVPPDWVLELTLTSPADGGQRHAVIDGRRVRVGDTIGSFVVESISPGKMILAAEGQQRIALRMN